MGTSFENYQNLRDQAIQAGEEGRWREALQLFESAWECAKTLGDEGVRDRAYCNLCLARIELRRPEGCIARLGEILLRSRDPECRWIATYTIARAHELEKNLEKSLFYAHLARDQASSLSRNDWLANAHNLTGNLLLADGHAGEAAREYEAALGLLDESPGIALGKILDNLGYCRILDGHYEDGFRFFYRSWRVLSRSGTPQPLLTLRLDLAFAHLEIDRYRHAARHAALALSLARRLDERDSVKNALYLLGESANLAGDIDLARRHFSELQEFYPELPVVTDLLIAMDVRKMINLRA